MTGGRVVVVGSLNMDVVATTARHPAVGETVLGSDLQFLPGGKGANQAVAAARLGAVTAMIGRVGQDSFGDTLLGFMTAEGVAVDRVRRTAATPTGTALIVVGEGGENTIVVVPGANATLTVADVEDARFGPDDVLVVQYEVPLPVVQAALARARSDRARTILNPAPAQPTSEELVALADVVVVNESELALLAGLGLAGPGRGGTGATAGNAATQDQVGAGDRDDWAVEGARRLRRRSDQVVVATLGAAGAVAVSGDSVIPVAGRAVRAVDTTGAGDCFVGALAAALSAGRGLADALHFANMAASLSVQRVGAGTGMPRRVEVEELDSAGP